MSEKKDLKIEYLTKKVKELSAKIRRARIKKYRITDYYKLLKESESRSKDLKKYLDELERKNTKLSYDLFYSQLSVSKLLGYFADKKLHDTIIEGSEAEEDNYGIKGLYSDDVNINFVSDPIPTTKKRKRRKLRVLTKSYRGIHEKLTRHWPVKIGDN